jgi:hypothetical protein
MRAAPGNFWTNCPEVVNGEVWQVRMEAPGMVRKAITSDGLMGETGLPLPILEVCK